MASDAPLSVAAHSIADLSKAGKLAGGGVIARSLKPHVRMARTVGHSHR
jgi:anti-anti-sigma regulatory factor